MSGSRAHGGYSSPIGPRVVALGGGHGLSATLKALRHLSGNLTAVVTVADDGGSSGRLRQEFNVLPPGDLRMALSALCDDTRWGHLWRDVLQHRFKTDGEMNNHALGNLLIIGLWEQMQNDVEALDLVGQLLGARGRVLPMASVPLEIRAHVTYEGATREIVGQSHVAKCRGHVDHVYVTPEDAPACPEALEAIGEAEWVVLGPGSWYTSLIPHLLVPQMARALHDTRARRALVLNLQPQEGETEGMSAADHIDSLREHAPDLKIDVVIADPTSVEDLDRLWDACVPLGAQVLLRQVRDSKRADIHDPLRLAAAFRDSFDGVVGDV